MRRSCALPLLVAVCGPSAALAAGPGLFLRPLNQAVGCAPPLAVATAPAPGAVRATLGALRRPRRPDDVLPGLGRDRGWLAVHSYDAAGVRRVGPAYVVPSAAVLVLIGERRGATCPAQIRAPTTAGARLVLGSRRYVGCWTLAEIRAGRALALHGSRLVGLRPDGYSTMTVHGRSTTAQVPPGSVIDVPTALVGGRVTVALGR